MRTTTMTLLLAIVPSLLAAQSTAAEPNPTHALSAQSRVQAEATLQAARDQGLPSEPLYAVMLEGQAKGATEAQILGAERQTLVRLALAQEAIVRGGRTQPSDAEMTRGASLMARGMSSTELSAVVQGVPSGQSLAVALDALAGRGANGMADVRAVGAGAVGSAGAGGSATVATDVSGAGSAGPLSATGSATAAVSGGLMSR